MPTTTETRETLSLTPPAGCGTLESPWTGWEGTLEETAATDTRVVNLTPGFYGVSRPVRLGAGILVRKDPAAPGQAWILPAGDEPLETLFLVDGRDDVRLRDLCLNGRGGHAQQCVSIRCGANVQIENCRFEDFGAENCAAVTVNGISPDRSVTGVVVKSCHFLNGSCGISLGRDTADLLVADNRFEEMSGAATYVDPRDQWADYGLIFVKNRVRIANTTRQSAFVTLRPGAEGIRIAENTFEAEKSASTADHPGIEIQGGGPLSRRRLEVLLNRLVGIGSAGLRARQCGPGFVAAGNEIVACGTDEEGAVDIVACQGVLVEDNEVGEPVGPGIRAQDCSGSRFNGNEIEGGSPTTSRGGSVGMLIQGGGTRKLRVTDNRISSVREEGLRLEAGAGLRIVGNEVEDCGGGIHVARARNLLLVGNDCRDNSQAGIRIEPDVRRGFVALNYAILNGRTDLDVQGEKMRLRSNKVDREGCATPESGFSG